MNRPAIYTGEIPRTFDILKGWQYLVEGIGATVSDILGSVARTSFGKSGIDSNLQTDANGTSGGTTTSGVTTSAIVAGLDPDIGGFSTWQLGIKAGSVYVFNTHGIDAVNSSSPYNVRVSAGAATTYGDVAADTIVDALQCINPTTQILTITGELQPARTSSGTWCTRSRGSTTRWKRPTRTSA